jgi:hypothetical protein
LNKSIGSTESLNLTSLAALAFVAIGVFNVPTLLAFGGAAILGLISTKQAKDDFDTKAEEVSKAPLDEIPNLVPENDRAQFEDILEAVKFTNLDTSKNPKDSIQDFVMSQLAEHEKATKSALALPASKGDGDFWHPSQLVDDSGFLKPVFFVGGSGCGKTLTVAHYLEALKDVNPDIEIYYASCVDRLEDSGIEWFCDNSFVVPLNRTHTESVAHIVECYRMLLVQVNEFLKLDSGLFFIDEYPTWFLIADYLKVQHKDDYAVRVMKEISHHIVNCNNNERTRKFCFAGQTGAIEAYGLKRFQCGNTQPIFLSDLNSFSAAIWQTAVTNKLAPTKPPTQEQFEYWKSIGAVKICGYNGAWHPVAILDEIDPVRNAPFFAGFPTADKLDSDLVGFVNNQPTIEVDAIESDVPDCTPVTTPDEPVQNSVSTLEMVIEVGIMAYFANCVAKNAAPWRAARLIKASLRTRRIIDTNEGVDEILDSMVSDGILKSRDIPNKNGTQTREYAVI